MTAPRRWLDSPDAPVGMRELLGAARPSRPLDEAAFARGAKRLGRASIAPVAAAAAMSVWTKLAAAGVLGLAAAAGTAVMLEREQRAPSPPAALQLPEPAAAPRVTPAPPTRLAAEAPPPAEPEPVPAVAPSPPPRSVTRAPNTLTTAATAPTASTPVWTPEETARPKSTLTDELRLVDEAKAATERRPEVALAKVAEHRARFPNGTLAAERDLIELDALRRAGRGQEARDKARAWLARDPAGLHAARVRAILASVE